MLTLLEVLKKTAEFFATKGLEHPRLDAELLVGHALGLKRMQLYLQFERLLSEPELERIRPLVRRRAQREPLQYIVGEVEWFGVTLKVDRRALIPRPETELLAEMLTQLPAFAPTRILDLGTGTGALALALAKHFSDAQVIAVDRSEEALALAQENTARCGLEGRVAFRQSDWFAAIKSDEDFDLIVSNPPYLTEAEVAEAALEVRAHEPIGALVASDEGLADLTQITTAAKAHLKTGGMLALETGVGHHPALAQLCAANGYSRVESKKDLAGRDRYILAWC